MNPLPKIRLYLEYFLIALVLIGGCTTVTYYFKAKVLKNEVAAAKQDLALAEAALVTQSETIRILRQEAGIREEANTLLKALTTEASRKADEANKKYRRLRDANPVVNDWATQPIPSILLERPDSDRTPH